MTPLLVRPRSFVSSCGLSHLGSLVSCRLLCAESSAVAYSWDILGLYGFVSLDVVLVSPSPLIHASLLWWPRGPASSDGFTGTIISRAVAGGNLEYTLQQRGMMPRFVCLHRAYIQHTYACMHNHAYMQTYVRTYLRRYVL